MANLQLARQLINEGNGEAAREVLNAAIRENPADVIALNMLWGLLHTPEPEMALESRSEERQPLYASPGATYTPHYWPDGGNTYKRTGALTQRMTGLDALEVRLRAFRLIEPYDQAELDRKTIERQSWEKYVDVSRRKDKIRTRLKRMGSVIGFAAFFRLLFAIDGWLGFPSGAMLIAVIILSVVFGLLRLALMWVWDV